MSSSRRNKNEKNAREKGRKQRKQAKLAPNAGKKKALKKDPGIPNLFPFKEKMLNQIQDAKAAQEAQKLEDKARLRQMLASAQSRTERFNESAPEDTSASTPTESVTSGQKDDSRKAYYKEFRKVIDQADVLLWVLDARDPLGCRSRHVERMIMNSGTNKRIVLVLNKIDLVPREAVDAWLKSLKNEFPAIAFKASTKQSASGSSSRGANEKMSLELATPGMLASSECLGADPLIKLLKNYCRNGGIKTSIRVGVIGFPNVGKSSVINSLKRARVCNVGSTPGQTKHAQEIHLDRLIRLIDSPGIVFSAAASSASSTVLRNIVKVELLTDPVAPVQAIIDRCKREQLMHVYAIPYFDTCEMFLVLVARKKGRIGRGGVPDIESAARCVLQDWNCGRIPYYCMPPVEKAAAVDGEESTHVSAAVVDSWAKEFDLEGIEEVQVSDTISKLKTRGEMDFVMAVESGVVDERDDDAAMMMDDE
ncbi:MAG: hypothetical protein SGCHY_000028 [Lobulomycetales sp.]